MPHAILLLLATPMISPVLPSSSCVIRFVNITIAIGCPGILVRVIITYRSVGRYYFYMEKLPTFTFSILVENRFGVLFNITGLFSSRGYNIERLMVVPD